jgi:hypothetical protein
VLFVLVEVVVHVKIIYYWDPAELEVVVVALPLGV